MATIGGGIGSLGFSDPPYVEKMVPPSPLYPGVMEMATPSSFRKALTSLRRTPFFALARASDVGVYSHSPSPGRPRLLGSRFSAAPAAGPPPPPRPSPVAPSGRRNALSATRSRRATFPGGHS